MLPRAIGRGEDTAMSRIKDYAGFVGWFAGLGYIVLWPITSANLSGKPFGASIFCRDGAFSVPDFVCNSAHPLQMPEGLHALEFLSALFVTARLLVHAYKRSRRAAGVGKQPTAVASAVAAQPPRKPSPQRPKITPRTHFGLRGMPQRAPVMRNEDAQAGARADAHA